MAVVTLELPETIAQRVKPITRWLPTILEINALFLKTPASQTANEIIEFLFSNPLAKSVYTYYVSEAAQARLSELMQFNREGGMRAQEVAELDELLALASIIETLKASLTPEEIV